MPTGPNIFETFCISHEVFSISRNVPMFDPILAKLSIRKITWRNCCTITNISKVTTCHFLTEHFSLPRNLIIRLRDSAKKAYPHPTPLSPLLHPNLFPHFCQYLSIGFDAESECVASQLTITYLCTYILW